MDKILEILYQHRNQYVSGSQMGTEMQISRTAINKAIKKLKNEGYNIISSTKKGYCLVDDNILIASEIQKKLNHPHSIEVFETIDSTNNYLKTNQKLNHIVIAKTQTHGRGRLNRSFYSPKNEGIYFSFYIQPQCDIYCSLKFTLLASVAVYLAIKKLYHIDIQLKWVNDLYYNQRKVGGILCEGEIELNSQQLNLLIIGIGINTHTVHFPEDLQAIATSFASEAPIQMNHNELISEIINQFDDYYLNKKPFLDIYRKQSFILHQKVKVVHHHTTFEATVLDILEDGSLLLEKDGEQIQLNSGEITIRTF